MYIKDLWEIISENIFFWLKVGWRFRQSCRLGVNFDLSLKMSRSWWNTKKERERLSSWTCNWTKAQNRNVTVVRLLRFVWRAYVYKKFLETRLEKTCGVGLRMYLERGGFGGYFWISWVLKAFFSCNSWFWFYMLLKHFESSRGK